MPFLVPLIPAIIGAGGAIGGGLLARSAAKKSARQLDPLIAQQKEAAGFALGEAKQTLTGARETLAGPLDFWKTILGGDRQEMLSALAPEVNTIVSQYDTARRNITNLAPRGGGRSAIQAESRFEEANVIQRLLQESRRRAATEVSAIGGQLTALGAAELGAATGTTTNLINSLLAKREQDIGTSSSIGAGIGDILGQIIGAILKPKPKAPTPTPDTHP